MLQLAELKHRLGNQDSVFEIISAYRSPKTNNMLRGKSKGVAKKSFTCRGAPSMCGFAARLPAT